MVNFLFWNINGKPLENIISCIVRENDVDVVVLAVCSVPDADLVAALNSQRPRGYSLFPTMIKGIRICHRFSPDFVKQVTENSASRLIACRIKLPLQTEVLLVAVHLPSKLRWSETDQASYCPVVAGCVKHAEALAGHSKTILLGDFNMNPFEAGVINAFGLHATMARKIAARGKRTVERNDYGFFYNPMWRHFGGASPHLLGTYYYSDSRPTAYFWNIFDQVLIRPELLPHFSDDDLAVLHTFDGRSLLTRCGIPDARLASDHLPILFKMNLRAMECIA